MVETIFKRTPTKLLRLHDTGKAAVVVAGAALIVAALLVTLSAPAFAQDSGVQCDQYGCWEDEHPDSSVPQEDGSLDSSLDPGTSYTAPSAESSQQPSQQEPVYQTTREGGEPVAEDVSASEEESSPDNEDAPSYTDQEDPEDSPENTDPADENIPEADNDPAEEDGDQADGAEEDPQPEPPLPGYEYDGEFCGTPSECGVEGFYEFDRDFRCAIYETKSGKKVLGCLEPNFWKPDPSSDCLSILFLTRGRPYSRLDNCRGERLHPPPEPNGSTSMNRFFKPYEYEGVDHDYTMNHPFKRGGTDLYSTPNPVRRGGYPLGCYVGDRWEPKCGLRDIPSSWECFILPRTVHGAVRGCVAPSNDHGWYLENVHFYDEAGNKLRVVERVPYGPTYTSEPCGPDKCGVKSKVPPNFTCDTVTVQWRRPYAIEPLDYISCEHSRANYIVNHKPDDTKTCILSFTAAGRQIEEISCWPQGGVSLTFEIEDDADRTEDIVTGDKPAPTGNLSVPAETTSITNRQQISQWADSFPFLFSGNLPEEDKLSMFSNRGGTLAGTVESSLGFTDSGVPPYNSLVLIPGAAVSRPAAESNPFAANWYGYSGTMGNYVEPAPLPVFHNRTGSLRTAAGAEFVELTRAQPALLASAGPALANADLPDVPGSAAGSSSRGTSSDRGEDQMRSWLNAALPLGVICLAVAGYSLRRRYVA